MSASLLRYDNPVLVSRNDEKKAPRSKKFTAQKGEANAANESVNQLGMAHNKNAADSQKQTDEILNSILPPQQWEADGGLWVQRVSSQPATRSDVIQATTLLDQRLRERQARETGICPVRRELYQQAFDELIRQVTIECAERGLLLLRVRDEINMTLSAYQTLYQSSVAFGMRKALQAEQGKHEMLDKIATLEDEKLTLERGVADLKAKCEAIERREAERRQQDDKKHQDEIQFLKRSVQQLKQQLEGIITPKK